MTELTAYFQKMLDESESLTLFVEDIIKYYSLASEVDKKLGAACIPKVVELAKQSKEQAHVRNTRRPDKLQDVKVKDMLEMGPDSASTVRCVLALCKNEMEVFRMPNDFKVPIEQFCLNCASMYFINKMISPTHIIDFKGDCFKLKDRVEDCARYIVGTMFKVEAGLGTRITDLKLSDEGASLLYYVTRYLQQNTYSVFRISLHGFNDDMIVDWKTDALTLGNMIYWF